MANRPAENLLATNVVVHGLRDAAAFAAKLVYPEQNVVCVVGDGGFQMTAGELAMARRLNLAVRPLCSTMVGWLDESEAERKIIRCQVFISESRRIAAPLLRRAMPPRQNRAEFRDALDWPSPKRPQLVEVFIDVASYSNRFRLSAPSQND